MDREYELIRACRNNDQRSQTELYEMYNHELRCFIGSRMKTMEAADEIISHAFERAFKKIEHFTFQGSFGGWLKAIARHCIYDYIKKNSNYHLMYVDDINDEDFGADKVVFAHSHVNEGEQDIALSDYMSIIDITLTAREKQVFLLYYEGYIHKEIADKFKISEGTSKWYLNSAREKLKKKITRDSLFSSK